MLMLALFVTSVQNLQREFMTANSTREGMPTNPEVITTRGYFAGVFSALASQNVVHGPQEKEPYVDIQEMPAEALAKIQAGVTLVEPTLYSKLRGIKRRITCKCGHYEDFEGAALQAKPLDGWVELHGRDTITISLLQPSFRDIVCVEYRLQHPEDSEPTLAIVVTQPDHHQGEFTAFSTPLLPEQEVSMLETIASITTSHY